MNKKTLIYNYKKTFANFIADELYYSIIKNNNRVIA